MVRICQWCIFLSKHRSQCLRRAVGVLVKSYGTFSSSALLIYCWQNVRFDVIGAVLAPASLNNRYQISRSGRIGVSAGSI